MKKTLGTIVAAAAVVLLTATFGFAQYAATGTADFPYFQLGCLIVGGLILVSLMGWSGFLGQGTGIYKWEDALG